MNYASLYNMRSCFTVKRGERRGIPGDPPPLREIRERGRVVASGWTDRDIVKRRRGRWEERGGEEDASILQLENFMFARPPYIMEEQLPVSCVRYPASICIRLRIHLSRSLIFG